MDSQSSGTHSVRVNVTSTDGKLTFINSNSRTIASASLQTSDLDFWLEGSSTTGTTISLQQISVSATNTSNTKGSFNFNFEPEFYHLTMYAVNSGTESTNVYSKAVLKASIAVDLNANDEIYFYLSSRTISANGYWELKIYADDWDASSILQGAPTAGIYNKSTGVAMAEQTLGSFSDSVPSDYNFSSSGLGVGIAAGTYLFKITFTSTSGTKFYYTDDIVILPNQTVSEAVAVPNTVGTVPVAPTYLIAGYQDNTNDDSDYYSVEFCWDDNSYNEEYYELQLLNINPFCNWNTSARTNYQSSAIPSLLDSFSGGSLASGITNSDMDGYWSSILSSLSSAYVTTYSSSYFENSSVTTGGSFSDGSVYAVLKLIYGNTYLARIRAVNNAGASDYVYLDLKNTGNHAFETPSDGTVATTFDADSAGISRYKITYYTNGGLYYDDSTYADVNSTVTERLPNTAFYTQLRSSSASIINPVNYAYSDANTASLRYYTNSSYYAWTVWKNGGLYASDFYDAASASANYYSGYDNLYLYANYGDVEITEVSYSLRDSSTSPIDADIVVTAHPASAASIIPFQQDTELAGELSPIYLSEATAIAFSKSNFKYANFLLNMHTTGADGITFRYAALGNQLTALSTLQTTYNGINYSYAQIDISGLESDTSYGVYYTIEKDGSFYKFTQYFTISD